RPHGRERIIFSGTVASPVRQARRNGGELRRANRARRGSRREVPRVTGASDFLWRACEISKIRFYSTQIDGYPRSYRALPCARQPDPPVGSVAARRTGPQSQRRDSPSMLAAGNGGCIGKILRTRPASALRRISSLERHAESRNH